MPDLFPVSDLRQRYGIGKQAEINRRKHLGITPTKVEGAYYITGQQVDLLDSLHQFLKSPGAKMADFTPPDSTTGLSRLDLMDAEAVLLDRPEGEEDKPSDWLVFVEAIARAIQPPNPIAHWEKLKWAADEGVLLSTKEVQQLTGAKPGTGKVWQRGSFTFTREGKIGNQVAWRVSQQKA